MHPRDARIILTCGLGFGDEGKGAVVDFLTRARGASLVVRYNGGPQAAHHVVTQEGITHCFSHFGSGTLVPGVRTFLSRFMLIDPPALLNELAALRKIGFNDAAARLTIDRRSIVVTPYHASMNRIREILRGPGRHGTCGRGVGEAVQDEEKGLVVRAGDLEGSRLSHLLNKIRKEKKADAKRLLDRAVVLPEDRATLDVEWSGLDVDPVWVADLFRALSPAGIRIADGSELESCLREGVTIFEGAQGVLLDRDYGFFPHVSPTRTTFANADMLLKEAGVSSGISRLGVVRAYATRHGEGPFVTEDTTLSKFLPEPHNSSRGWQGPMRVGSLDLVFLRYAIAAVGGLHGIALTHLDRLAALPNPGFCSSYEFAGLEEAPGAEGSIRAHHLLTGSPARDLILPDPPSTKRQEDVTRLLFQAKPVLKPVSPEAFSDAVARETSVPVVLESRGPDAGAKKLI